MSIGTKTMTLRLTRTQIYCSHEWFWELVASGKMFYLVGSKEKRWRLLPKVAYFSGISLKPLGRQLQSQTCSMTPTGHGSRATRSRHNWMACQILDQAPGFTPGEGSLPCRWVWHRCDSTRAWHTRQMLTVLLGVTKSPYPDKFFYQQPITD